MKKVFKLFVLPLVLIFISAPALLAQGGQVDLQSFNPNGMFVTFGAFVAAIMAATEVVKKLGGKKKATPTWAVRYSSWFLGFLLAFVGWHFELGFFADLNLVFTLAYGLGAVLAANGFYDTEIVQKIISFLVQFSRKNK